MQHTSYPPKARCTFSRVAGNMGAEAVANDVDVRRAHGPELGESVERVGDDGAHDPRVCRRLTVVILFGAAVPVDRDHVQVFLKAKRARG